MQRRHSSASVLMLLVLTGTLTCLRAQGTPDKPYAVQTNQAESWARELEPLIAQARRTLPAAKARIRKGLNRGYQFFSITRLSGGSGRFEQLFVRVSAISEVQGKEEGNQSSGQVGS